MDARTYAMLGKMCSSTVLIALVLIFAPSLASAQRQTARAGQQAALQKLSRELATVQADMGKTTAAMQVEYSKDSVLEIKEHLGAHLMDWLTELANIQGDFRDNPYVRVDGFSVNIGVPPSVTVNLSFKKSESNPQH
jgi:hypothetical protein